MKGHALPGIKQKNGGKVDTYKNHHQRFKQKNGGKVDLTKTPVGPVAKKKGTYDEKEEQIIENMDNAKDNNFSQWGHDFVKTNKAKKKSPAKMCGCGKKKCSCGKKSPAKCPLVAALPMITQAAGAIGAVASAKKAVDK